MEPLEEIDEDLMYWYYTGIADFLDEIKPLGYGLDKLTSWNSLNELERYIIETKVTHAKPDDDAELRRFVFCYIYLGFAINRKYKTRWIIVDDGTADDGMFAVDNLPNKADKSLYFVPRQKIKSVILGRLKTSLKESVRARMEDAYVSSIAGLRPEV